METNPDVPWVGMGFSAIVRVSQSAYLQIMCSVNRSPMVLRVRMVRKLPGGPYLHIWHASGNYNRSPVEK